MKKYLPIVIGKTSGHEYTNVYYSHLGAAMEALAELISLVNDNTDDGVADAYVRNVITGKEIR